MGWLATTLLKIFGGNAHNKKTWLAAGALTVLPFQRGTNETFWPRFGEWVGGWCTLSSAPGLMERLSTAQQLQMGIIPGLTKICKLFNTITKKKGLLQLFLKTQPLAQIMNSTLSDIWINTENWLPWLLWILILKMTSRTWFLSQSMRLGKPSFVNKKDFLLRPSASYVFYETSRLIFVICT